ncbi:MAG: family 43 glycosylhydrolase [Asticcacaulis sp.]
MRLDRRHLFKQGLLGLAGGTGLAGLLPGHSRSETQKTPSPICDAREEPQWSRGPEGQRQANLGDGLFLNPIVSGDRPDPSILRVEKRGKVLFYMVFSTFDVYPGLLIWRSEDLLNWTPVTAALTTPVGSVWAPELCAHKGRYYLYFPTKANGQPGSKTTNWVMTAPDPEGPWSEPLDLNLPRNIDPGHAVAEDGSRWLFLNGGQRVRLSDDGLRTLGVPEKVYDPWRYPSDWDVEGFSPEGPKIFRRGAWFYMVTAVGGTAGPPTGHMVIAARSRSLHGPWEHHPRNPLVRTQNRDELWWSRGHATIFEASPGNWWAVYHGYERDFVTLGRQTLLAPVTWDADGWFDVGGGDLSKPLRVPFPGQAQGSFKPNALSDDFRDDTYGIKWAFFKPDAADKARIRRDNGQLILSARGQSPRTSSPLCLTVGDRRYSVTCRIRLGEGTTAGVVLFYDDQLYCGLGFDAERFVTHQYGLERGRPANPYGRALWLRVLNRDHIVSYWLSKDGEQWDRFDRGMDVSGYHHNTKGGFLALRPGLYAAGAGEATFSDLTYRAL